MKYNKKEAYAFFYSITNLSYLLRDRKIHLKTDHKNLTFIGDSTNAMIDRWKLALMQYDFDIEHISGVKTPSQITLVDAKNHMENNKNLIQQLMMTAGFHGFIIPDDGLVGHSGLEQCLKRLINSKQTWKYKRKYVRDFVWACPCCQKMRYATEPLT